MRKTLLAAAIVGVFAPSFAHAQSANVTLYGILNLDAEVIINVKQDQTSGTPGTPPSGARQNIYRVSSNSSRFGMRGTESLGGGLNAIFQLESSVTADNSGGTIAGRDTFAGIQGPWGTVKIGYFFTPYYDWGGIWSDNPTFRTSIFATQSLWANNGYGGATTDTGSFAQRAANSIRYESPDFHGFQAAGQVGARDVGGDGGPITEQRRHAYTITGGGQYRAGPFNAAVVYERHNWLREGNAGNPKLEDDGIEAGASYDFGIVKIAGVYEHLKYDVVAVSGPNASGGDLKRDLWGLTGTANVGPGQLFVSYYWAGNGKGSAHCTTAPAVGAPRCPRVGALTLGPDTKADQWEVTYTYPLSKRTLLYTGYTYINNRSNAAYNFGVNGISGICTGNGAACGDSGKPQGFAIGLFHSF